MKAVASGDVPEKFVSNQYPVLSETGWRTCGMRVLGYWIRKENPSDKLKVLANFVTKAYGPTHIWDQAPYPETSPGASAEDKYQLTLFRDTKTTTVEIFALI